MKSTMNRIQKNYMVAKALVAQIESRQEELERKYISEKGIRNPDGSVPELLFCMDDDAAFDSKTFSCIPRFIFWASSAE